MVHVTPVVDVTVLTDLDGSSANCTCSENCWCVESLFLPPLCTHFHIHEIPCKVSLFYFFLIMLCISSNLLNYITIKCHHLRIYSVLCSHPLYTSQIQTSLLSKFLIEHDLWVHGYTSTILYCNGLGTLTSVVISILIDMQGLYVALYDNME